MACKECAERRKKIRDAVLHGKMAEAVGQTVTGLREMIGFKADEPKEAISLAGAITTEDVQEAVSSTSASETKRTR